VGMISRWLRRTMLLENADEPREEPRSSDGAGRQGDDPQQVTVVVRTDQGDGGGEIFEPEPQGHLRQLVNLFLWILGPALVAFGIVKWPHLVSVGLLVLVVQATNRWGLRRYGVPVGIKRIYTFGLVAIGILLAQPTIGEGIASAVAWSWHGIAGDS
jgi:hypothetical protein